MAYEDLRARALSRADLADDVAGINSSIELIQRARGGGWPTGPVTEQSNYVDLVWHELEFREGYSFAYVVRRVRVRLLRQTSRRPAALAGQRPAVRKPVSLESRDPTRHER
jgi:hypothetical protein